MSVWSVPSLSTGEVQGYLPPLRVTGSGASVGLIHSFAAAQASHVLEQQVLRGHRGSRLRKPCRQHLQPAQPPELCASRQHVGMGHLTAACYCCHAHPGVSFHTRPLSLMCFTFLMSWELCWGTEHLPLNVTLSFLQRRKGIFVFP